MRRMTEALAVLGIIAIACLLMAATSTWYTTRLSDATDATTIDNHIVDLETAIVPGIFDDALADAQLRIGIDAAWDMVRRLGREAGLFVGLSAGAAVTAAFEVAGELEQGVVVTLLPDDGSKYTSLGIFD